MEGVEIRRDAGKKSHGMREASGIPFRLGGPIFHVQDTLKFLVTDCLGKLAADNPDPIVPACGAHHPRLMQARQALSPIIQLDKHNGSDVQHATEKQADAAYGDVAKKRAGERTIPLGSKVDKAIADGVADVAPALRGSGGCFGELGLFRGLLVQGIHLHSGMVGKGLLIA